MAHPDLFGFLHTAKDRIAIDEVAHRSAVLTAGCVVDFAAEGLAGELHPVADTEDGDTQVEQSFVALRGTFFVNAVGAAREDDAFGGQFGDAFGGDVMANDLAIHILFANAAGDQLRVLRSKIEDQDALVGQPSGFSDGGRGGVRRRGHRVLAGYCGKGQCGSVKEQGGNGEGPSEPAVAFECEDCGGAGQGRPGWRGRRDAGCECSLRQRPHGE